MDTNVIIEAHRTHAWPALVGGYAVETVEDCVTETQTGFQRRRSEEAINRDQLLESLANVHAVNDLERAELAVRVHGIALDLGEWSCGRTRGVAESLGCCAVRTRQVCGAESGLGSESGLCRSRDCCTRWVISPSWR